MTWKGWVADFASATVTAAQAQMIATLGGATASAAEINLIDTVTATSVEIVNKCDGGNSYQSTGTTSAYAVLAANTGKLHQMVAIAANQTITLPTPAAGLNYKFVFFSTADEGQNFIIDTGSDTNYFLGGVQHEDTSDTSAPVYSDGGSNSIFTMVVPGAGTEVNVLSNGTIWWIWGRVVGNTVPTFADQ